MLCGVFSIYLFYVCTDGTPDTILPCTRKISLLSSSAAALWLRYKTTCVQTRYRISLLTYLGAIIFQLCISQPVIRLEYVIVVLFLHFLETPRLILKLYFLVSSFILIVLAIPSFKVCPLPTSNILAILLCYFMQCECILVYRVYVCVR